MLRNHLGLWVLGFVALVASASCSSDEGGGDATGGSGGSAGSGGSSGSGGTGGTPSTPDKTCEEATDCIEPPTDPGGGVTPPKTDPPTTVAISQLFLGDTDREGNVDGNAWKSFGYNLDGLVSTANGSNHCKPAEGANPGNVKTDGNGGIDNSFGANLMLLILSLAADASDSINLSLDNGDFTVMLRMANLEDTATEKNQSAIGGALLAGAKFDSLVAPCGADGGTADAGSTDPNCSPPKFDGTDSWPLSRDVLQGADPTKPNVSFPSSFVVDGKWVSGTRGNIDLAISIQGVGLTLKITNALITMDITGKQSTAQATNGTIAGVINTEGLIEEIRRVAGSVDVTLCEGSTFESIAQQIRTSSDIMNDGTNGDPSKTCDAISVGLGFNASPVLEGAVAPVVEPPPNPCATP